MMGSARFVHSGAFSAMALVATLAFAGCGQAPAKATASAAGAGGSASAGSASSTSATGAGAGGEGGAAIVSCLDPLPPFAGAPGEGLVTWHLNMGELDLGNCPDGTFSAWENVGLDLDGRDGINDANCEPAPGATSAETFADGKDGIDNAFGHLLLPVATTYLTLSDSANTGLAAGEPALYFQVDGLATAQPGEVLTVHLLRTAPLGAPDAGASPRWDGTDVFPLDEATLPGGGSGGGGSSAGTDLVAQATFDGTTLDFFYENLDLPILVNIVAKSLPARFPLQNARVRLTLDEERRYAKGVIGAMMEPLDVYSTVRNVAGNFIASLCDDNAVEDILTAAYEAQDIRKDGATLGPCDAISIGVLFEAVLADRGAPTPVAPPTKPCEP